MNRVRVLLAVLALTTVSGGAAASQQPPQPTLSYTILPDQSELVVTAHKSGLFSFLAGHEHGIVPTAWAGRICIDSADITRSSLAISVPAESLVIDSPEARRLAGLDPQGGPGPDDRAKIQQKMLGPEVLDTERYPEIGFQSEGVAVSVDDSTRLRLTGSFELHGRADTVRVPVTLSRPIGDSLRARGQFQFRQTRFGIEPESVAGLVNVKDEMTLRFDVVAVREPGSCRGVGAGR
ncbi:MAG TPA: YceI family protein [Gemmatimonadales bacterium]|nr:YceI family protein [Gemmatimonadales bacterium]